MTENNDQPMPKPRKHPELMQSYLYWREVMLMRQRHELRKQAVERGASNMDADMEAAIVDMFTPMLKDAKKSMVAWGKTCGPVWGWLTSIKGLGEGGMAAQLLAQIDDIGNFDTVSKLWRFAGYAVIDGKRETNQKGEKSHFNRTLKSLCYLITEQFIKQQTPVYAEIYYDEKERQVRLHPELTKGHIHSRAMRKVSKIFLQHVWVTWREMEGLPVSEPYAHAILLHTHLIPAPGVDVTI